MLNTLATNWQVSEDKVKAFYCVSDCVPAVYSMNLAGFSSDVCLCNL